MTHARPDSTNAPDLLLGLRVADRYEVVRHLSTGGMASVYEALDTRSQSKVALKVLHAHHARQPTIVRRFQREAHVVSGLDPRHVATVKDAGCSDGLYYLVLDLLSGEDLRQILNRTGRLPVTEAVDLVLDVCRALRSAHLRGLVHRDIKPSNIFVALGEDGVRRAKLLDFGIAKHGGHADTTDESTMLGTVTYMAPEQVVSSKRVDHRADLYALGLVLYEAVNGRPAHDGERAQVLYDVVHGPSLTVADFSPDVPRELAEAIVTATARDPEGRHQDVTAFASCLAPFAGSGLLRLAGPYPGAAAAHPANERHGACPARLTTRSDPVSDNLVSSVSPRGARPSADRNRRLRMLGVIAAVALPVAAIGWISKVSPTVSVQAPSATDGANSTPAHQQPAPPVARLASTGQTEPFEGAGDPTERALEAQAVVENELPKPATATRTPAPDRASRIGAAASAASLLIEPGTLFAADNPYDEP